MAISRMRGSSAAIRRGVNAPITSLRWRLWRGGSIRMIVGALAAIAPIAAAPSSGSPRERRTASNSCVPCSEVNRRGRCEISWTSAYLVTAQNWHGSYQWSGSSARSWRNTASASRW